MLAGNWLCSKSMGGGGGLPFRQATYYEVGVGDGFSLFGMALAGMQSLVGVDVTRLISEQGVTTILKQYQKYGSRVGLSYPPTLGRPTPDTLDYFLHEHFRINYCAPHAVEHTPFPTASVDYMASNVTFEHIPLSDLPAVIKECYRLLKPHGVFCVDIDYNDHSLYGARSADYPRNGYQYLSYSLQKWHEDSFWLKADRYYQNRLRTKDYLTLFQTQGFRVLVMTPYLKNVTYRRDFAKVHVDSCFANYTTDELLEQGCTFVLTKDWLPVKVANNYCTLANKVLL